MSGPLHYERGSDRERPAPVSPPRYGKVGRHVPTASEFLLCSSTDRVAIQLIQDALTKEQIGFIRSRVGDSLELIALLADQSRAMVIANGVLARRQRVKEISPKPSRNEPDPFNDDRYFVGI